LFEIIRHLQLPFVIVADRVLCVLTYKSFPEKKHPKIPALLNSNFRKLDFIDTQPPFFGHADVRPFNSDHFILTSNELNNVCAIRLIRIDFQTLKCSVADTFRGAENQFLKFIFDDKDPTKFIFSYRCFIRYGKLNFVFRFFFGKIGKKLFLQNFYFLQILGLAPQPDMACAKDDF
jgi:hypothetical protein